MKQQRQLPCGGKQLVTNSLESASEWILDNIAGLREFEVTITIHSEDLGCDDERTYCCINKYLAEEWPEPSNAWANQWMFHGGGRGCKFDEEGRK